MSEKKEKVEKKEKTVADLRKEVAKKLNKIRELKLEIIKINSQINVRTLRGGEK